jgi:hypothetical protein
MSDTNSLLTGEGFAERFLERVSWTDRLPVSVMGKRGINTVSVYSVEELLKLGSAGAVVISGSAIALWFEEVMGDSDLARGIRQATEGLPLFEEAQVVLPLVSARYREAVAAVGAGSDSATALQ